MAAQSRESVDVSVQPLKLSFEAMATLFLLLTPRQHLEQQLSAPTVQLHIAQLINTEKIDSAVGGRPPGVVDGGLACGAGLFQRGRAGGGAPRPCFTASSTSRLA